MDVTCGTACTVHIEPTRMTDEDMADYLAAFWLMFVVLLGVWGGKQVYKVFEGAPHDGS